MELVPPASEDWGFTCAENESHLVDGGGGRFRRCLRCPRGDSRETSAETSGWTCGVKSDRDRGGSWIVPRDLRGCGFTVTDHTFLENRLGLG